MGDRVGGAAFDAGLRHAEHLGQPGNEPVAGQKGAPLPPGIAGGVFAEDTAAQRLHFAAQFNMGLREGLVDGGAQKAHGGHTGLHGGGLRHPVQTVRQTADDDRPGFGRAQRQIMAGIAAVDGGSAGAHHAHIPPAVEAVGAAGGVEHQRRVGQIPQPGGEIGILRRQHRDAGQNTVVHHGLELPRLGLLQTGAGAGGEPFGTHPRPEILIQLRRTGVVPQQLTGGAELRADRVRQPEPVQTLVHVTPPGTATAARCPPRRR